MILFSLQPGKRSSDWSVCIFAAHYEKEGDKIFQDYWFFFSLALPPIADPVGSK